MNEEAEVIEPFRTTTIDCVHCFHQFTSVSPIFSPIELLECPNCHGPSGKPRTLDEWIEALERVALAWCEGTDPPEPYELTFKIVEDCDHIWCPFTGAIAICVDDDMRPVRIVRPKVIYAPPETP